MLWGSEAHFHRHSFSPALRSPSNSAAMKRKDFENAYDDFSCFSVAASARKSRRLDCELPPIVEEDLDSGRPVLPDQGVFDHISSTGAVPVLNEVPSSQELAIVLYNPASVAAQGMVKSPSSSNFSLVMDPDLFSEWRGHMLRQGNQSRLTITELDDESDENNCFQSNNSMAVVPWVASQQPPYAAVPDTQSTVLEPMEAGDDCEMMETDDYSSLPGYNTQAALRSQQPHCLIPEFPPNTYTPIRW